MPFEIVRNDITKMTLLSTRPTVFWRPAVASVVPFLPPQAM